MLNQETLTKRLKTIWGAHHFLFTSKDVTDIATLIKLPRKKVEELMRTPYWDEALFYWGHTPKVGDLKLAQQLWTELVEKGEHINPVDYADTPHKAPQGEGDPAVYPLIQSHLFCVDNLSERKIREHLAEDGNPVRYEDQQIRGYHWFVYPNEAEGLYSKALAKVNVAGDLVIDYGDDETCLVCIRHGRLTITCQVSDDVANIADERLLLCLSIKESD